MYSHFTPYVFTFFIILQCFMYNLPSSLGADDYFKYTNCTQPIDCGVVGNISFPFWGHNRAEYCGQPGYELRCENDRIELVTDTLNYLVLNVDDDARRVHIVEVDTHNDPCPAPWENVSFPYGRFNYTLPTTVYITLFYECPAIPALSAFSYPCSPSGSSLPNYVWNDQQSPWNGYPEVWQCGLIIRAPILQRLKDRLGNSSSSLQQVLREGFEVGYTTDSVFCRSCQDSGGHCGYNSTAMRPMCFCYDDEYEGKCPTLRDAKTRASVGLKVAIGISAGVGCVILVASFFILWKWQHSSSTSMVLWERRNKTQKLVEDFLKNYESLAPERYNYHDLIKITSSFKDKIGQGGYGEVYKGKLSDGRLVAVKLLNDDKGSGGQEFINEVATISKTSHVNIVSLVGFCFDGSIRALIYEFMVNGSLEKFIYDRPFESQTQLGWEILYRVAIGVARGLEYLHRGCNTRILHFDIKPHNILLDIDFNPKISDFGLAKLCLRNESIISMSDARGTAGYIAPEVFYRQFGGVSHKSDVYSYGMMVLEIVGKRKNINVSVDHPSEVYFPHWIYKRLKLDEDLGLNGIMSAEEGERARKMTLVALWCIQTNPMDRPAMTWVVEMLEASHELSIPPNPYLSSPPRSPRLLVSSSIT